MVGGGAPAAITFSFIKFMIQVGGWNAHACVYSLTASSLQEVMIPPHYRNLFFFHWQQGLLWGGGGYGRVTSWSIFTSYIHPSVQSALLTCMRMKNWAGNVTSIGMCQEKWNCLFPTHNLHWFSPCYTHHHLQDSKKKQLQFKTRGKPKWTVFIIISSWNWQSEPTVLLFLPFIWSPFFFWLLPLRVNSTRVTDQQVIQTHDLAFRPWHSASLLSVKCIGLISPNWSLNVLKQPKHGGQSKKVVSFEQAVLADEGIILHSFCRQVQVQTFWKKSLCMQLQNIEHILMFWTCFMLLFLTTVAARNMTTISCKGAPRQDRPVCICSSYKAETLFAKGALCCLWGIRVQNGKQKTFSFLQTRFFFLFCFVPALALLFPFLPMALTQLGLSPAEASLIYGIIPFVSAVTRVLTGSFADKLQAHKIILMTFCVCTGVIFLGFLLIPPAPRPQCELQIVSASVSAGCSNERDPSLISVCVTDSENAAISSGNSALAMNCSNVDCFARELLQLNMSIQNRAASETFPECRPTTAKNSGQTCFQGFVENALDEVSFCFQQGEHLNCSSALQTCSKRTKYDRTFWIAFAVSLLGYIGFAPTSGLMHAIAYAMLGEARDTWGKQRCFGTLGFLIAALIIGIIMQLISSDSETNLTANFVSYFALFVLTAIFVYFYEIPGEVKCGSLLTNLNVLARNPIIVSLFSLVLLLGTTMGTIETFLLLYIKELGGKDLLLGLSLFMNCVMEVPALYLADMYLGKLGYVNCLYLTCVAFSVRFLAYGFIHNPWLVLPVNFLHSITFGVMYCTAGAYGSANTPPGMHGTIQGSIQALHFGFGRGIGSVVSGQLVENYGMRTMFFIFSGISLLILALYFVMQCFLPKQNELHKTQSEETQLKEQKHGSVGDSVDPQESEQNIPDVTSV